MVHIILVIFFLCTCSIHKQLAINRKYLINTYIWNENAKYLGQPKKFSTVKDVN